jgi:hypothetical protein
LAGYCDLALLLLPYFGVLAACEMMGKNISPETIRLIDKYRGLIMLSLI